MSRAEAIEKLRCSFAHVGQCECCDAVLLTLLDGEKNAVAWASLDPEVALAMASQIVDVASKGKRQ